MSAAGGGWQQPAAQEKFSPSALSARLRLAMPEPGEGWANELFGAERPGRDGDTATDGGFAKLADDIRSFLAAPRGGTEEERRQYNERLNRAVLGYYEERTEFLAIINDRLMRKRILELPGYSHGFHTLGEALFAEVIGLNVLELVMANRAGLEEIQVVGTRIFEVRGGSAVPSIHQFDSIREVERIQQNLVLYNNDRINPRKRWAEAMLSDGTRVTMTGFGYTAEPTLTMRFYTVRHFKLRMLCEPQYATMNERIYELLCGVLRARFNLVIIGPTNSGKTHLIKALIAELPDEERIVTIETRLELMLRRDFPGKNIIEYEADEEDRLHSSGQAFRLALRQSPERIVHAEVRDEDANIYVRACTRGHSGSMTTVHASAIEDIPEAITDMCMLDDRGMDPERLTKRITQYVSQVAVQLENRGGIRRIARIGELYWDGKQPAVRDWVKYDAVQGDWLFPELPSAAALARMGGQKH